MRKVLILILLLGATSLFADVRLYRAPQALGKFVPRLVDQLGSSGFQFTVKNMYNEAKDGKQGFVFLLQPRNSLCEIVFFAENEASSFVRIRTQDAQDSDRFDKFFSRQMNMSEVGVSEGPAQKADPSWPTP